MATPCATPEIMPVEPAAFAIEGSLVIHVPPGVEQLSVVDAPGQTFVEPSITATAGLTVTMVALKQPGLRV